MIQKAPMVSISSDDWIIQIRCADQTYTKGCTPHTPEPEAISSAIALLPQGEQELITSVKIKRRRDSEFRKVG